MLIDENTEKIFSHADYLKAEQIIADAASVNVKALITIGSTTHNESINCSSLAQKYDNVFAAIGIFPHDCTSTWHKDLEALVPIIKSNNKIVAIGECGLDFHYPDYLPERQKDAFKAQIELALKLDKAIIIHTRQAPDETLKIIDEYKNELPKGVFHCFSEDLAFARHITSLGFYLGIPGTITYPKNDRLREIVATIGLEHIVLETDSPYLPPQHMRGQKNYPREVATIATYIAQLIDVDLKQLEQKTTTNALKLFNLPGMQ
jgi:TatD DNase family protein